MKDILLKNLGLFFSLFILIVLVLLFANLQMEKVYLREKLAMCDLEIEECKRINDRYRAYVIWLVENGKISEAEFRNKLPASESEKIINQIRSGEIF